MDRQEVGSVNRSCECLLHTVGLTVALALRHHRGIIKMRLNRDNFCWELSRVWLLLAMGFATVLCVAKAASGKAGFGDWDKVFGPFYAAETESHTSRMTIPVLFSSERDSRLDSREWDVLYPLAGYDRYGKEWRLQFFQLVSFSGGSGQAGDSKRTTVFPFYFRQVSADPEKNYWALFPFYGTVKGRFLRDEVKAAAFPLYVRTRKKDVVTDNYLAPFFHLRHGENLKGWQLWPLAGWEEKGMTARTNILGEESLVGGHRKLSIAWPFYFRDRTGLGTDRPQYQHVLLPFFSSLQSPGRDSFTAPWPVGLTVTHDRERKYREIGLPWPFIVFARGEGKTASRIWPLFGRASNKALTSNFYAWPIYRYRRLETSHAVEQRTRWFFFLFTEECKTQRRGQASVRRRDLWPLFTCRTTSAGERHFQALAFLEPLFPANETIPRHYSPLWSVWTSRRSAETGESSQSFLWNLYRRDAAKEGVRGAALFGLIRWQRTDSRRSLKILGLNIYRRNRKAALNPARLPAKAGGREGQGVSTF